VLSEFRSTEWKKEMSEAFCRFMAMAEDEKMFQFQSFSNNKTQLGRED
jgi:hypothetical protein